MYDATLKINFVMMLMLLNGCATSTIIDSTCVAYEPVRNYLECTAPVIYQIEVNNEVYRDRCDSD